MKFITTILATILFLTTSAAGKRVVVSAFGGEGTDYFTTKSTFDMPFRSRAMEPTFYIYAYPDIDLQPGDTLMVNNKVIDDLELYGYDGTVLDSIIIYPYFALGTPDTCTLQLLGHIFIWGNYTKITGRPNGYTTITSTALNANNCRIKIGDPVYLIANTPQPWTESGIEYYGHTGHMRVDCVSFQYLGYGIKFKTDPPQDADIPGPDTTLQYPNSRMVGLNTTDCYFNNINQDILYLGNTDPLGLRPLTRNGVCCIVGIKPMAVDSIDISYSGFENCGRTNTQFSRCQTLGSFHHCYVRNCGGELNDGQGNGVISGGMSAGIHVYSNTIKNTYLYNLEAIGTGGRSYFESNTLDSAGYFDSKSYLWTMFMDMDSLKAATGRTDYDVIGNRFIKNTITSGIYNIIAFPDSTYPASLMSVTIKNNITKANSRTDGYNIGFPDNFKGHLDSWATTNLICLNVRANGTASAIYRGVYDPGTGTEPWPIYRAVCITDFLRFKKGTRPNPVSY